MSYFKLFAIIIVLSLGIFACSSDKNNPVDQQEEPPQGLEISQVEAPAKMQNSTDPQANLTVTYLNLLNSFQTYTNLLTPQGQTRKVGDAAGTTDGPPWVYSWTNGTLKITLTINIEDRQYHWKVVYDGSLGEINFDNFVFIEAWSALDGKSGSLVVNDNKTGSKVLEWNWQKDDEDTVTMTFWGYLSDVKIIATQKADLSGSLEYYEGSQLTFKATWTSDGSGSWWVYDNGTVSDSGTWS
ncbi:MAG: hypothetical protein GXO77_06895 [Calditrichaeota bacterium]|nr:hypothetical protein [Calditrichota bacterium]